MCETSASRGRNAALMVACEPLRGYSWLVDAIRRHKKACGDLGEAVDRARGEMPDGFRSRSSRLGDRAEVRGMVISGRYDQLFLARYAEENRLKGKRKAQLEVATNMLKSGESIEKIVTCCGLSEDEVRSLEEGMLGRV